MIEDAVPGLYICGGFQFLGTYYKEADGTIIEQLGVLDVYTENPGSKRLIGNIAIQLNPVISNAVRNLQKGPHVAHAPQDNYDACIIIGFENHGGRTRLGKDVSPLGTVVTGYGSNAEDHTEGAIYKNSIGTYLHGPILPKNPVLTDWLIAKALERKYQKSVFFGTHFSNSEEIFLPGLDDTFPTLAHDAVVKNI